MKITVLKLLAFLTAVVLAASAFSACGVDPNVKQEDEATADYKVKIDDEDQETERDGYYAYGKGKTDPVKIGDVTVNVKDYAVRSYELGFMMAQKKFDKPKDIPLEAAVQYAFIHVFYDDFYTINNKTVQYRSAQEKQIRDVLKTQFGTDDYDVTSSMLYNADKKIFEMWIPSYGTNIYYNIDAVNVSSDEAEIITTFYNELERKTLFGKATITVRIQDGRILPAPRKKDSYPALKAINGTEMHSSRTANAASGRICKFSCPTKRDASGTAKIAARTAMPPAARIEYFTTIRNRSDKSF